MSIYWNGIYGTRAKYPVYYLENGRGFSSRDSAEESLSYGADPSSEPKQAENPEEWSMRAPALEKG